MNTRESWLRSRQQCLCGTDLPCLLGIGFDGKSAANVYAEKIGELRDDQELNEDILIGVALEEHVAQRFVTEANKAANTGLYEFPGAPLPLRVYEPSSRLIHRPDIPWVGASVDRLLYSTDEPVECKTAKDLGDDWGESGSDVIPHRYAVQVAWQCLATGSQRAYVGCLFRGWNTTYRWYRVEADAELAAMLLDIASDFWCRVQNRTGVDDWQHGLIPRAIDRATRVVPFKGIMLPPSAGELAISLERAAESKRLAEAEYARCKTQALKLLGDAERGMLPDGRLLVRERNREVVRVVNRKRGGK